MNVLGSCGMQYIILENEFDYTEATFYDLFNYENVKYYRFPINSDSRLLKKLYVLHGAQKINRFLKMPGQKAWNRLLFDADGVDPSKPVCFIYSFRRIDRVRRSGFLDFVNSRYSRCYHVAYWDDLVKPNHLYALEFAKTYFDLVFTYDEGDAKRYGMRYYPSFCSKLFDSGERRCDWDVVFVGNAKDRLKEIYSAYEALARNGVVCKFIVNNVSEVEKRDYSMIDYNYSLTYREVLDFTMRSNCILEIVQSGSRGQTLRVNEAVVYGKRLLSNNPAIRDLPQYDNRFMRIFAGSPSWEDCRMATNRSGAEYRYPLSELSPVKFIETIESLLSVRNR